MRFKYELIRPRCEEVKPIFNKICQHIWKWAHSLNKLNKGKRKWGQVICIIKVKYEEMRPKLYGVLGSKYKKLRLRYKHVGLGTIK